MSLRIYVDLAQYSSSLASLDFLKDINPKVTAADMLDLAGKKGISRVPGTVTATGYANLIECYHYEHQLGQTVANFPTAGIAVHNTFYLQKSIDKTSAALANYCHFALPLMYAIIYILKDDTSPPTNLFTYILTGVNVARLRQTDVHASETGATFDPVIRESVHLAYRGIVWIAYDDSQVAHTASADRLFGPNTPGSPNAGAS